MADQIQINLRAMFDLEPVSLVATDYPRSDGGPYYPQSEDVYFECLQCGDLLSSSPSDSGGCTCGNVFLDIDAAHLGVKDHDKMRVVRLKRKGNQRWWIMGALVALIMFAMIGVLMFLLLRDG